MMVTLTIAWRVAELAERGRVDLHTIARLSLALGVYPGALWDRESDPAAAWDQTAGAAGEAWPDELDELFAVVR